MSELTPNFFENDNRGNRRSSLRLKGFFPTWFKPIDDAGCEELRSRIIDASIVRHARYRIQENEAALNDSNLKIILERIERLEHCLREVVETLNKSHHRPYETRELILSAGGFEITSKDSFPKWHTGDLLEIHLVLPVHQEAILALGRLKKVDKSITVQFVALAGDQEEWLIQYLVQRQQEELRLKKF